MMRDTSSEPEPGEAVHLAPGADRSNGSAKLPFHIGTGIADITPPLDVGLLMSSVERRWAPFKGVRRPLHARALLIQNGTRRIALVSLELLGLSEEAMGGMEAFRRRAIEASGRAVGIDDLVLVATHTHSAPETLALSPLCQTPAFQRWAHALARNIGLAIAQAAGRLTPCQLSAACTDGPALGIHRRIKTTRGVLLSHPEPPAEIVISREGAVDSSIHIAAFRDGAGRPAALLVNAACHPVHEMCIPYVSPDYPGVMSGALERQFPGARVLFLNGADGNVNPPTVSAGPAAAEGHGLALAELVDRALGSAVPVRGREMDLRWRELALPARRPNGARAPAPIAARLAAMRIGDAAMIFIPGEPFAETGLAIREQSPFRSTFVVGYAEGSIGYIPTAEAFAEGGYETGPGAWSPLAPGSEEIVRRAALALLEELRHSRPREPARTGANALTAPSPLTGES